MDMKVISSTLILTYSIEEIITTLVEHLHA